MEGQEYQNSLENETIFVNYLKDNWKKLFPKSMDVKFNYPIYGCVTGEKIGIADIFITKGKINFIGEIKLEKSRAECFWESLKVIGYCISLNLHRFKYPKSKKLNKYSYFPFIMIPGDFMTYDYLPILYHLKCGYILYSIKDDSVNLDINLNFIAESFI